MRSAGITIGDKETAGGESRPVPLLPAPRIHGWDHETTRRILRMGWGGVLESRNLDSAVEKQTKWRWCVYNLPIEGKSTSLLSDDASPFD